MLRPQTDIMFISVGKVPFVEHSYFKEALSPKSNDCPVDHFNWLTTAAGPDCYRRIKAVSQFGKVRNFGDAIFGASNSNSIVFHHSAKDEFDAPLGGNNIKCGDNAQLIATGR